MDLSAIVTFVITSVMALIVAMMGWWLKELYKDIRFLQSAHNALTLKLVEEFVHKEDFEKFTEKLFESLEKIENKLDRKMDK